jgi:Cu/Ag efflux protein CusF
MKTQIALLIILAATLCLSLSVGVPAQESPPVAKVQSADGSVELTAGEIRKVDKENGKITIRHGEIRHLDMPGMTMVFRVSDPALLDRVKAGDKVRFRAEKVGGTFVVTAIVPDN